MKRLLASILILSLSLAACSHDDGNSNKEDTNKSEQHDSQKQIKTNKKIRKIRNQMFKKMTMSKQRMTQKTTAQRKQQQAK